MDRYAKSLVDWFGTAGADRQCPAKVTLNGGTMCIEVMWDSKLLSYHGEEKSAGFYHLKCDHDDKGHATLHRRPDNTDHLEGSWVESHDAGMWSVLLDSEDHL